MKRVAVTGGSGHIAYSLLFRLANGDVFGDERLIIQIHDLPACQAALAGVAMELEDAAFPLVEKVEISDDLKKVFDKADAAFLIGAKPRGPGMERADLLQENGKIFVEQGRALNEVASRDVVVLVVGNPCNTNCLIALKQAPNLNPKNFHAMMRLDENRATSLLAKKSGVAVSLVNNVIVWGNHSASQVPDISHANIKGTKALEVIKDKKWVQEEFVETVQKRGAAIIKARGKSSAASAASAAIDAMHAIFTPTPEGEWFTSAVLSDGNGYGIEEGLIFGFPCRSLGKGKVEIVEGLDLDFFIKEKIAITQTELIQERSCVF